MINHFVTAPFFHGKIPRGSPQKESIAEGEENDETFST